MTANIITGYFVFLQEPGDYSTTLRQVTLQITNDSECSSAYVAYKGITDRMICAGDPTWGKGACWVIGS